MLRQLLFTSLVLILAGNTAVFSQNAYQFEIGKTYALCSKASASLSIAGTDVGDTITVSWSTGQSQVNTLTGLDEGSYAVNINIKSKLDTNLYFTIDKEECPVSISQQFTPNGDGYNDFFYIGHVGNYPNFELEVFNKWGQRVHRQKGNYTPWDGTWGGIKVPDGTYYYVFFFDAGNKGKLLKGDVSILR